MAKKNNLLCPAPTKGEKVVCPLDPVKFCHLADEADERARILYENLMNGVQSKYKQRAMEIEAQKVFAEGMEIINGEREKVNEMFGKAYNNTQSMGGLSSLKHKAEKTPEQLKKEQETEEWFEKEQQKCRLRC